MSSAFLILLFIAAVIAFGFLLFLSFRNTTSVQRELDSIRVAVTQHLSDTVRLNQESGTGTVKAISDVYTRLGSLEASAQKIFQVGEDIARLQTLLKAPKTRGGFGEWMLQDLLQEMIPKENFALQHQFRNGSRVDAVLFVGDHLVSVDAKFPLENFERMQKTTDTEDRKRTKRDFFKDVKKHVDDIANRYIFPGEGTLDFALMYIPAESIYYELIDQGGDIDFDIYRYAMDKRVIPVSPNSFYAYLQVILMGLRRLKIDEQAKEIARSLVQMRGDFKKVIEELEVLGNHLTRTQGGFDRVRKGIERFDDKLSNIDSNKTISKPAEEVVS